MPNRKIFVNDIRVRGIGKTDIIEDPILSKSKEQLKVEKVGEKIFSLK